MARTRQGGTSVAIDTDLIGRFYEAVLREPDWFELLTELAERLGAHAVHSLEVNRFDISLCGGTTGRLDPEVQREYAQHYFHMDFRVPRLLALPPHAVYRDSELASAAERQTSPLYREFLPRHDRTRAIMTHAPISSHNSSLLTVARSVRQRDFTAEERHAFGRYAEHFNRVLTIRAEMTALVAQATSLEETAERADLGLLLLDESQQITFQNAAARGLLQRSKGMSLRGQWLVSTGEPTAQALEHLIRDTIADAGGRTGRGGGNRVLRTSREEGALEFTVIPIRTSALRHLRSRAVVALQIMDMTRFESTLVNTMRERYRFTPAESRCVDLLCHGLTLSAIASHLKISTNTVKTHLRSVFSKTGTTRQAELVALLNRHASPDAKISSR